MSRAARILVVDNRDSFTANVVQALREAGACTGVVDSRHLDGAAVDRMRLDGLVISPGPGGPADAGNSLDILEAVMDRMEVWGICLGLQCLAVLRGARVVRAARVVHGKTSRIHHDGRGLFEGLPDGFEAMRYNSLVVDPASVPSGLEISARSEEGEVMGLRCARSGAEAVQFHPESVGSGQARAMFATFARRAAIRGLAAQGVT